jgi:uncharacterized protein YegP (UPF0339 family)
MLSNASLFWLSKECVMAAKFEIKKGAGGQYRFNLKAANGEPIGRSETYSSTSAGRVASSQ